ncbi:RNA exonuclease 3 [Orbilia blumenaviensis]|uniref:RNA exonuclease 3 n=1 Tax=Orbilia blumenaviensis TaxID=1796055 RepID=A0AAV9U451_9PEZI
MFRPSGLFKAVPCPKVSTCSLHNCLFSHQPVVEQSALPSSSPPPYSLAPTTSVTVKSKSIARNERSPTPPPPPKRRKIDDGAQGKSVEAPSNPVIKSILKKSSDSSPSSSAESSSSSIRTTATTTRNRASPPASSPPFPSSLDTEDGKYIKVQTTNKKTGIITKTRIERGGPSPLSSLSKTTSKPVTQPVRSLHTSSSSKQSTPLPQPDVTKKLLDFGKTLPREPERLIPRTVPRDPAGFEIRHKILAELHKQFMRLDPESQNTVAGKQRMIKLANDEEVAVALKAVNVNIYRGIMKNRIFSLLKMNPADFKKEMEEEEKKKQREENPDPQEELVTGLKPEDEALALAGYVASFMTLKAFDYVVIPPSEEDIRKTKEGLVAAGGEEECDRCKARFKVLKEQDPATGLWVTGGSCTHHYGRCVINGGRRQWGCCGTAAGETSGCTEYQNHVFMVKSPVRLASIWQFVETPPPASLLSPPGSTDTPEVSKAEKAVCMDCEMAFTTKGFEVIRLTATRFPTYETIVDILVQPYGEVLDLNTRFSGVTQEQFDTALPYNPSAPNSDPKTLYRASSPLEAREILFKHIDSSTILIGHALDNDLKCMRIIHQRIVDTAVMYRHRTPGMRFSLKYLVKTHLGRFIQLNEGGKGHDSKEDANEAGNLVRKKIKNDVKLGKIGLDGIWKGDAQFKFQDTTENIKAQDAKPEGEKLVAAQTN